MLYPSVGFILLLGVWVVEDLRFRYGFSAHVFYLSVIRNLRAETNTINLKNLFL